VTDSVEGVVPEFMTLLHGVLDSPDIPLNVSRSYLQSDQNVKKISTHITKKVADKLEEMFKNDREDFEKKWDAIKVFIQYGCVTDDKFYDRAKSFYLLKNIENKYFTFDEYKTHIETLQKDKEENLIYLYAADVDAQHVYINAAKERGYDVLCFDGFLDTHFINMLEQKMEKARFTRVDADIIDKLIQKDEVQVSKLSETETTKLKELFDNSVEKEKFSVTVEPLSETDLPILLTRNEFKRRYQDMEKLSGQKSFYSAFDHYTLVVNGNHELANQLLQETDSEKQTTLTKQLIDLALLSQNLLTGEKLGEFVKRSVGLLKE
jgi:molecular chaperone HtpG